MSTEFLFLLPYRCRIVASTVLAIGLFLLATAAQAFPGGIVGRTLPPSCGACHGPASANTSVALSSSTGSYTVAPSGVLNLSLVVSHSTKVAAGMNVSVQDHSGANAGDLEVELGSGLRTSLGEVTHSSPKMFSNGRATFTFTWTAPTAPGSYILRGSGNAVDLTGGSNNDEFNYLQNSPVYLNVTGQVAAPSIVLPVSGATLLATTATLQWSAVSGALQFEYELSTSTAFTTVITSAIVNATVVTVASLQYSTTYYWRVRSLSALSTSAYVPSSFATVFAPPTSLALPVIYSPSYNATGVETTATLVWSTVENALQYDYQVSTRSNYSVLAASGTLGETTATISGLDYNTFYYWRVRARYGSVLSGYRSGRFTTLAGAPPTTIEPPVYAINIPSTAATLVWSALSDAAGYTCQVATQNSFAAPIVTINTTDTSLVLPALQRNTQYFWRVAGYGTAMGTTAFTTANFVTEIPRAAARLRIENATTHTLQSNTPFTVLVRTHNAAGRTANVTQATVLVFSETHPQLTVIAGTQASMDMGHNTTVLTLALHSASTATLGTVLANATTNASLTATSQSIAVAPVLALPQTELIAPADSGVVSTATTPTVFAWKAVAGAEHYIVQVATAASFVVPLYNTTIGIGDVLSTMATTELQLPETARYYWRVRAANVHTTGTWSASWSFLAGAPFLAPHLVAPANSSVVNTQTAELQWQAVGTPSLYRVQLSTSAVFSSVAWEVTTASLYATTAVLQAGMQYYWRVQAVEDSLESEWSASWAFHTNEPLVVLYPNGGEWLLARSTTTIVWSANANTAQVRIELSENGGVLWQTVTAATANTGEYHWAVPNALTTQALLRITDTSNATLRGQSAAVFGIAPPAPLDVTLYLEGAYDAGGSMTTTLHTQGYVPLTDPYGGGETVSSLPADVTDWVQLEFRAATTASVRGTAHSLLLRSDGRVVAPDGSTTEVIDISRTPPGEYWVVLHHRNHISAMSATTLTLSVTTPQPYNFTTSATAAYSSFQLATKAVQGGFYALYAGDATGDGAITAGDRVQVRNHRGRAGYEPSDVDLDGVVNAADRVLVRTNRFIISQVP